MPQFPLIKAYIAAMLEQQKKGYMLDTYGQPSQGMKKGL
jgi:hypothetical protein